MANFTWLISQLDSTPSINGLDKVVSTIHYRAQKESNGFLADHFGAIGLQAPHESSFIPYSDITQELVYSWLEEVLDVEEIELILDAKIENFINPPIVVLPLPWVNAES